MSSSQQTSLETQDKIVTDSTTVVSPSSRKHVWIRRTLWSVLAIGFFYGMIYVDVVMRAREAYQEGEKFWRWSENPTEKAATLQSDLDSQLKELEKRRTKNQISQLDFDREKEILVFDHNRQLEESSIKYAYIWYKTAYEMFSPPESKWVKLSREKAPLAKEKWKAELKAKGIPFEDYMLD